jgi:AcrR family transcriptional regulator
VSFRLTALSLHPRDDNQIEEWMSDLANAAGRSGVKPGSTARRGNRLPRDERRGQLLIAASDIFVDRGYHAAGMDEIAERAGVSKPVLYQHFPGKQELYLALLDESVEKLVEAVKTALRSTTENRQRVNATFAAYYGYVAEHRGMFRLVFESDLTNEPAVRERVDTADRKCADMISQIIKEDAGLGDEEAHLLGISLVGMAQVSARYWLSTLGTIPKDAAEQLVARLAWRGISGWPRTSDQPEQPSA